ncbi:hypothetical protein [Oleiagrimonas sp. C23AA]|uniref:hypothetical protein n=1 Tax=Oleiagrimonas sp. C23AA TaxID=2719047 RepID=UPI001423923C|nr:hypothetical protein [Oleiagrimonas sp. C23AA]NII10718.1 hypothetical protein [Oleiagrimonas sp. C23AA]
MPHTHRIRQRRARIASLWLGLGTAALIFTPLPVYSTTLGFTAPFWLVLAPLLILGLTAPRAPIEAWRRLRQRSPRRPLWSA